MWRFEKELLKNKIQKNKPICGFDPLVGFWGIPNLRQRICPGQDPNIEIEIVHNEYGMREVSLNPSASKEAILCLGGSHTWGGGVTQEERYSDLLARRTGCKVINMGHCSLGIDQIAIVILKRAKEFNPKIIVVEQYPWAVVRILNNCLDGFVRPFFSLDSKGQLRLRKVPWIARFVLFRKIIGSFYTYRKELREFQGGINLKEGYDPLTDPIFCYWKTPYYNYIYDLLQEIIVVIRDFCLQNDIRLLFSLGAISQQFSGSSKSSLLDYDLPRKRLKTILEELGVPYVDIADAMLAGHSQSDPVIFPDGHINAKGHSIFASVLQKDLEKRGWI